MWQAVLALGVALIGFLGVALGAVVTGYVTLRQAQLATQREREAQQMLRWQARKDAHDAFQRDAVVALQEAVANLSRMAVGVLDDNVRQARDTGQWPTRLHAADYPTGADELFARVERFRARVFDDELRQLALEVSNRVGLALGPTVTDFVTADGHFREIGEKRALLQQRVNTLLKGLYLY